MDGEWIIPFAGRNKSGAYNQNFLWRNGVVYVMDNHRAALWCWLRHLDRNTRYNLIHIDRHSDTLNSQITSWTNSLADLDNLSIQEYLERKYCIEGTGEGRVIGWDNYLSIFLRLFPDNVDELLFATAGEGDKPQWERIRMVNCFKLCANLAST